MSSIISVKVLKLEKHPNANKLQIALVSDGKNETKVICGANNIKEGMITILAQVGSITPKGVEIKLSNLRGEDSYGMLCSPKDLLISDESGIIDLPKETPLGKELSSFQKSELSSTPWYLYKLVDTHRVDKDGGIRVEATTKQNSDNIISQSYWDGTKYIYRNYSI